MDHDSDALLSTISAGFRLSNIRHYKTFSLLPAAQLNTYLAARQRQTGSEHS